MKMIVLWVLAALFTLYSIVLTLRTSFTTGTLLVWLISICFILLAVFHGQLAAFTRAGWGRVLKYIVFAGIVVYAGLFVFVAVSGYTKTVEGDEKAVIILGAGLRGETVSDVLRRRLEAGLSVWEQNQDALIVVSGGQGPQEDIPEALAMQRWLIARGVPEASILVEDKSTSTEENLAFSRDMLAAKGIGTGEPVVVVTNAFHCYRGGQYARKVGFSEVRLQPASMNITTILPSYMREVLAVLDLWVFKR